MINAIPDNDTPKPPTRGRAAPPPRVKTPPVTVGKPATDKQKSFSIAEITRWFEKTYLIIGTSMLPFKPALGQQFIMSAPKCAKAMSGLCATDPKVRRIIEGMMTTGKYGAVIAAHLPIILVLAAEYASPSPEARFNQQTIMGLASVLSDEGLAGMMFSGNDDDEDDESETINSHNSPFAEASY